MVSEVAVELDGIVHVAGILTMFHFSCNTKSNEAFSINYFAPFNVVTEAHQKKGLKEGLHCIHIFC